jgi:hypothetical protein
MDELHDMVSATGATFLGLTVGCARCHNHKFDPISQKDYYAMQAIFSGVQHGERTVQPAKASERFARAGELRIALAELDQALADFQPLANPACATNAVPPPRPPVHPRFNVERFHPVEARSLRFTILETTGSEPCIDELEIFTADENPRNIALASAGARASASGTYPNSEIHRLEHIHDGREAREWPQLDLQREWQGLGAGRFSGDDGSHRQSFLGPRPRRQIHRPTGHQLQNRNYGHGRRLARNCKLE